MNRRYLRTHLSDQALHRNLMTDNGQELGSTADLLADIADIAEFDARKLFRPAGFSSMFAYCVGHLRRSEVAAYKRIRVARAARRCWPNGSHGLTSRPGCNRSRPLHRLSIWSRDGSGRFRDTQSGMMN